MQEFPHHYFVSAAAGADGDVTLNCPGLPGLATASPAEFGGPGDRWSPETLLVGAVADCFVLTFRAVARSSRLRWMSLRCEVEGTLDRVERVTAFTGFTVHAFLQIPTGTDPALAERALAKSEQVCLVSSSLKGPVHLHSHVELVPEGSPVAVK